MPEKPYYIHLDFAMEGRNNLRFSFSNLYKEISLPNNFVIQIPLELTQSWTILTVDVLRIMELSELFPEDYVLDGSHKLKSFTFCSEMKVRGLFTSDNFYPWNKLPLDFQFKAPAGTNKQEFEKQFVWTCIPSIDSETMEQYLKESSPVKPAISEDSQEGNDSIFRNEDTLEDRKLGTDYEDSKRSDKKPYADKTMTKSELAQIEASNGHDDEISDIDNNMKSKRLAVDPILNMDYVIGFNGKDLKWCPNKAEKSIVYASGGVLVSMNVNDNKQRFILGHTDLISCFCFSMDGDLIASAQDGPKAMIRICDYQTGKTFAVINPKVKTVDCLSFNNNRSILAASGRDDKNKETIMLWNVSVLNSNTKPTLITKQISNFNIIAMKFSPIDPYALMSCGRENIRCWRLKSTHLQGASIVLDHRARNTIFTDLDYEYKFKSSDLVENESLSRIYVSSKTGLIIIINYHTKKLENAYQIHDGPIQSISVNDAFCVTGSEDKLLRVWLLDFSEYYIEAPHDGTVSAVDISPDGNKIICGTANGCLGMVDITKEKYVTLLRSHSDEIIAADYNMGKNYIITVSRDKTIRLWGVDVNFQKIYEFVSPNDQAISVSSHPQLALFACGFESGTLRIFDIERTKVCEVFSQFNLPLCELTYSSDARLLLTAAKDGYIAIHNAKLQHQPIKMLSVDFPPPNVSLAFDPTNSVFGAFGDHGNYVNIYDTVNFSLVNTVNIKKDTGKCFVFSPYNYELVVATVSNKIRIYDLKVKGSSIPLREISNVHREAINSINFSLNGNYFITCGDDKTVRVFDSSIDKMSPYFFQSFIGHTFAVKKVFFNPANNQQCISIAGKDGIHFWKFNGDVQSKNSIIAEELKELRQYTENKLCLNREKQDPKEVEEIRVKQDQNKENHNSENIPHDTHHNEQINESKKSIRSHLNEDLKETEAKKAYEEYKETDLEQEGQGGADQSQELAEEEPEEQPEYNDYEAKDRYTYDGNHAQDNVIWLQEKDVTIFSSENEIIAESNKDGYQHVFEMGHSTPISSLAISYDNKFLASSAATADEQGTAPIIIWDIENGYNKKYELRSHELGVKNLLFSKDGAFLISQGCTEERSLVVWDVEDGLVIKSTMCPVSYNGISLLDNYDCRLMFTTAGNEVYRLWKLDSGNELLFFDVDLPESELNLTAVCSTPTLGDPYNIPVVLIGTDEGDIIINNPEDGQFLAKVNAVMSSSITLIECRGRAIILADASGNLVRHTITDGEPLFTEPGIILTLEGPVTAISFDENLEEGRVGTGNNTLSYVNWKEGVIY